MRELWMASAAVIAPANGPNMSQAARSSAPPASNTMDAILAIGIVLAAWAVALWGVSYFSRIVS
jgi:hypothetical protein